MKELKRDFCLYLVLLYKRTPILFIQFLVKKTIDYSGCFRNNWLT